MGDETNPLKFEKCSDFWHAWSALQLDGVSAEWQITVRDDGLFYVDDSDSELTENKEPFSTFAQAAAFCQGAECVIREEATEAPVVEEPHRELDRRFAEKIRRECMNGDNENDHRDADDVLCELLSSLGTTETVAAYEAVPKWYA